MLDIIYSKPKLVQPHEDYLVCKRIGNQWHIVASYSEIITAVQMEEKFAQHDLINGLITDPLFYRIFHKNLVEIKETL